MGSHRQLSNVSTGHHSVENSQTTTPWKPKNLPENKLFWVNQFSKIQPFSFPFLSWKKNNDTVSQKQLMVDVKIPPNLVSAIQKQYPTVDFQNILLATLFIYFYRISGQTQMSVNFSHSKLNQDESVPYTVILEQSFSISDLLKKIITHRTETEANGFYPYDSLTTLPVAIELTDGLFDKIPSNDSILNFVIPKNGNQIAIYLDKLAMNQSLEEMLNYVPRHLLTLLTAIGTGIDSAIDTMPLLSPEEEQKILVDWNKTDCSPLPYQSICELFSEQAKKTPEHEALKFEDQSLTYSELDKKSNQLAHCLRALGVTQETLVAVCLERSLDLIVTLLGILKAGGAYVPLEATYPKDRLAFMLENSHASLLVTQTTLLPNIPTVKNVTSFCLDKEKAQLAHFSTLAPQLDLSPNQLVYILYTSGSTGQPKGVEITHGGLINLLLSVKNKLGIRSNDRWLMLATISFDISNTEIYVPLLSGATVVIAPKAATLDPTRLNTLLQAEKITFMQATPPLWRILMESRPEGIKTLHGLSTGEALPNELAQKLSSNLAKAWNLYGPTETTIYSTIQPLTCGQFINLGRPLNNTELYILDDHFQPVPIGVVGELYIGGVGLARGYLGRPDLTKERFVQNPFSKNQNLRLYKTGDLCRYLFDGSVEFVSRSDNQVKIRGFRIELGEIETQLRSHPEVSEAIVVAREDSPHEKRLVAYWVAQRNIIPTIDEFKNFLKRHLPDYMLPNLFIELGQFPINPNGKLDYKALPAPQYKSNSSIENIPKTNFEQSLVNLWSTVLNIKPNLIGTNDNFFTLGGDSIHAMELVTKIKNELDLSLPIETFFNFPTIAESAKILSSLILTPTEKINAVQKPLDKSMAQPVYPLTPLQQGLLFQKWRDPDAISYQIQIHWDIHQPLDLAALKLSWEDLINRHDVLRSSFIWEGLDNPIQRIEDNVEFSLAYHDWKDDNTAQQKIRLADFLEKDKKDPIHLNKSPLFRVTLIQFSNSSYKMVWHSHHMLLDGWSIAILISELSKLYQHYLTKEKLVLDPVYPFSDYVTWMHEKDWSNSKPFWQRYLKNFKSPTALPIVNLIPLSKTSNSKDVFNAIEIELSLEDSQKMTKFSQSLGITLSTYFQGLWGIVLHRYSQSNDILFGVTISGRNNPLVDSEKRVGLFINTLPLRIHFTESLVPSEFLPKLQREFTSILPFSHSPLTEVHGCSELQNTNQALFDSIVVFENYPKLSSTPALPINTDDFQIWDPTHYALTFIVTPREKISLKIGYDSRCVAIESVSALLEHIKILSAAMIENPFKSIDCLNMLSADEYYQSLHRHGKIIQNPSRNLIESIEEWAIKTPNRLAVHADHDSITYCELNKISNQLAHYLRAMGVISETSVGICLPRSTYTIISLLGIWKSGASYVPLNAEYPSDRLHMMILMSHIKVVITERSIYEKIFSKQNLPTDLEFFFIEDYKHKLSKCIDENPAHLVRPHHLAYTLYTSGSTGIPKGVLQEHKTINNLVEWQTRICPPQDERKIAQLASISFDVSLQEISYALINGYELHIVPSNTRSCLSELFRFLKQNQINQVFLPTALLEPFCEAGLFIEPTLPCLTDIFVSGEALKISALIKDFFATYPHIRLTNQYGPTETHVVTAYQLPKDSSSWPALPPIGVPIDNTTAYVLDDRLQPVPIGVPGQLYIGGTGVARGYIDNAKESARFIENPFSKDLHRQLYQTGDKVKWTLDGQLEFIYRVDEQIKIRGYRIEPKEIEVAILKHPKIRQCTVLAEPDHTNTLQLICYLIAHSEETSITELKEFLNQTLPNYMIPTHFFYLKSMPVTLNGKIDKKALPSYKSSVVVNNTISGTPRNAFDKDLMMLFKQVLNIAECGIHDNFFTLGGHSLSVLRLLLMIEKKFNVQLAIKDFLLTPTIEKISDKIIQDQANQFLTRSEMIHYQNEELPFPLVPLNHTFDKKATPLFLIHPVGGTLFWFVELAAHMGIERPIYGIQDPSIIAEKPLFDSIEAMASFYLYCIRQIQPAGPYLIAGSSFGATVAFEIARQLEETNEKADFVGLLDGWSYYPKELQNKHKFQQLTRREHQQLYQIFQANELKDYEKWQKLQWHRNELLWRYSFVRLKTKLTLFKSQELMSELNWVDHPYNYWDDYSDEPIEVAIVPGNHETMFKEPNVKILAARMSNYLKSLNKT